MKGAFPKLYMNSQSEQEDKALLTKVGSTDAKTLGTKCNYPDCTGVHSSNDWHNMCPVARERKRSRQAWWAQHKYWTDLGWAANKRWDNWCYKGTSAGMLSAIRSKMAAKHEKLHLSREMVAPGDSDIKIKCAHL